MKSVDLYAQVRFAVQIEGVSRREAARRFGIDPRTVAKMLAFSVPPGYRRNRPPARPKLDPFTGIIDRILLEDGSAAEAAAYREADLRTASRRARLLWRDHHCERLRAVAAAAASRGLRAAAARSWPCAGGFW